MLKSSYARDVQFDNGYGASIVSHDGSYGGPRGLFEIALIDANGDIIHGHPLMGHSGVIGWLDFENVVEVLNEIKKLPKRDSDEKRPLITASWMEAHGCKSSQMRGTPHRVHNGGWYNAAGQKIGWGDLDDDDLRRLADEMPTNSVLFILAERDSFWNFVTYNPGIVGDMCETSPVEKLPGIDYVLEKAMIVIVSKAWYIVDRYGYSFQRNCIEEHKLRDLVDSLLYKESPA